MCFPQLRVALISLVSMIGFFSGCGTPYGTMGGFSEVQLAPDIYRVYFSLRLHSLGSGLSGGTASLRCAGYSQWLSVFRRLNDRELRLGEQF
jgi:hypothetical protein